MEKDFFTRMFEKNKKKEIDSFREALSNGRTININIEQSIGGSKPQLGDSLIRFSGLVSLIREYAKLNNLPEPKFGYSSDNTINAEMYPISSLNIAVKAMEIDDHFDSALAQITEDMADALGVAVPQTLSPLEQIPDHPWLSDFDRKHVEIEKQKLLETSGERIVVIVQTGSDSIKRWSTDQIKRLAEVARKNSSKVFILSDALLRDEKTDQNTLLELSKLDSGISTVFFKKPDDVAIYSGIADIFLSTDSGPGWIWGCEKKDKSTGLIQHVVASDFWKVPGAEIVESKAVEKAKQENIIGRNGLLQGTNNDERLQTYNTLSGINSENSEMTDEDFQTYLKKAEEMLLKTE